MLPAWSVGPLLATADDARLVIEACFAGGARALQAVLTSEAFWWAVAVGLLNAAVDADALDAEVTPRPGAAR